MGNLRNFHVFLFVVASIYCSCTSNKRLIVKTRTEYGRVTFYSLNLASDKNLISKVYVDVDSSGVRKYYSFYPDRIIMTNERAKNLCYTVLFDPVTANNSNHIYPGLSRLDSLVFSKAKEVLKNARYSHLKKPEGSSGWIIEVNYYHGFPKNRKFHPL